MFTLNQKNPARTRRGFFLGKCIRTHVDIMGFLISSLSRSPCKFLASDYTMYPFSTQNAQDFDNLLSVYLDAVFFPNIRVCGLVLLVIRIL